MPTESTESVTSSLPVQSEPEKSSEPNTTSVPAESSKTKVSSKPESSKTAVSSNPAHVHYDLVIWQFCNSELHIKNPNGVYSTNKEYAENEETIIYKEKTFYPVGSGGPLPKYTLTDEEIILKYSAEQIIDFPDAASEEYRLIVNGENNLIVTYANGYNFEEGDILELIE